MSLADETEMVELSMHKETVKTLLAYCEEDKRVCPQPIKWHAFYELLCENAQPDDDQPLPPLILAAWSMPAIEKIVRLQQQIEWSNRNEVLAAASKFLRSLREEDWFHFGD
jgi:hypothetical protein